MMNNQNKKRQRKMGHVLADPGNILLLIYIAFVAVFVLLGGFGQAWAKKGTDIDPTISFDDVQRGELLIPTKEEGRYTPAPLLDINATISINGITAKTIVKQRFENSSSEWVEAIYAFPLPDDSAVDRLRMIVGERVIEGEVKEKQEAKKVYEQAKSEGKKSSLLVQHRPNIFTTSVANIAPGETISVEIEYHQTALYTDNVFSLRFPMVIAPRYIPGTPLEGGESSTLVFDGGGWARNTNLVPDASHITPHVVKQGEEKIHPVSLKIELASGFPLQRAESLYHGMDTRESEDGQIVFMHFNNQVKADRDFVLEWEAEQGHGVTGALFSEVKNDRHYKLLMVMPPERLVAEQRVAREMIFVLDTSGSMAGESIVQAKKALLLAISRLNAEDHFNIIEFNSEAHALFSGAQPADLKNLNQALAFVKGLRAEGGTEIAKALDLALDGVNENSRLRQVVFLTDGSVGNEQQLFGQIHKNLGDSRLFTVGIGSAPNSFFMTRAASMGRGTFTFIGKVEEVEEKMTRLFKKLENPVITGLQLQVPENVDDIQFFPNPLPDLFAGEPLIVSLKTSKPLDSLTLNGKKEGTSWEMELDTKKYRDKDGIATLWARNKIRNQMESLSLGEDKEQVKHNILRTALEHHLVSKYTSLVAVEQRVSRPADKKLVKKDQKTNLPHGMEYGAVFGGGAKTATPATMNFIIGMFLFLLSLFLFRVRRQL